ncbi:MAG: Scaffold-type E3 ligase [Vezdaea aestivalis]|nr:MAG: Scaffold-type E3 ligase [Vezdaea aestivalis]
MRSSKRRDAPGGSDSLANTKRSKQTLKTFNWNAQQAIDSHFQVSAQTPIQASASQTAAINKLFDSYRDSPKESPDLIGVNGAINYFKDLGIKLDDPVVLAVQELLNSQAVGEFSRQDFVAGWSKLSAETLQKQREATKSLRKTMSTNPDAFKQVYRHTFLLARPLGQKSASLDMAVEFWKTLFSNQGGYGWSSAETPWLEYWVEFVEGKWKRSINKDMWNMLLEFAKKTKEDEDFGWWDEGGAWPGSMDEFVGYVKKRREGLDAAQAVAEI